MTSTASAPVKTTHSDTHSSPSLFGSGSDTREARESASRLVVRRPSECSFWKDAPRRPDWVTYDNCAQLYDDIEVNGIVVPLIGRLKSDVEVIVGIRRLVIAQEIEAAGKDIRVSIELRDLTDVQAARLAHQSNLTSEPPTAIEYAQSYARQMSAFTGSQNAFARSRGIDKGDLSRMLTLNNIPPSVFEAMVDPWRISASGGYRLARIFSDPACSAKAEAFVASLISAKEKLTDSDLLQRIEAEVGRIQTKPGPQVLNDSEGRAFAHLKRRTAGAFTLTVDKTDAYTLDQRRTMLKQITSELSKVVISGS